MKKVNLLPNLITAFGLACGLFVIFRAFTQVPHSSTYHLLYTSALLLLVTAIADVLDGAVARLMHFESEFGALFDSLADAISFGVAPSVLVLIALDLQPKTLLYFCSITAALLYSICGVLRLVRYNVKDTKTDLRKNFSGFPIPAAAGAVLSANLFLASPIADEWFAPSSQLRGWILIGALAFIGLMMVSKIRFPSLKSLQVEVRSIYLVCFTALGALVLLYGLLHYFSLLLLIVTWSYLLAGCALTLARLIAGKKSSALKDFEPEKDDE